MGDNPVPPGERVEVEIHLDTRDRQGRLDRTLTVYSNDPRRSRLEIHVTGSVETLVAIQPGRVSFPRLVQGTSAAATVRFTGDAVERVKPVDIRSSHPGTLSATVVREGGHPALRVTLEAGERKGRFAGELIVGTGLPAPTEIRLPVFANVQGDLVADRPFLLFPPPGDEQPASLALQVSSASSRPFRITAVRDSRGALDARIERAGSGWRILFSLPRTPDPALGKIRIFGDREGDVLEVLYAVRGARPPAGNPGKPKPASEPPGPPPGKDAASALFVPDRILEIGIEMDPDDWNRLRHQARSDREYIDRVCQSKPQSDPYTYFQARVRVDDRAFERVGVKKRGYFGSMDARRPSLKLHFARHEKNQRLAGLRKLTLNNAREDPSLVRPCLALGLFRRAGLPAPRCNLAHVRVNGQDLGIYVNVESIDSPFLERHFGSGAGNLYEGAHSDFRASWIDTFQRKNNRKQPDRVDLATLAHALGRDDEDLLPALEPLVDLDAFLTFWALEGLLAHKDGYAAGRNNFFVFAIPATGKFVFLPWGLDALMRPEDVLLGAGTSVVDLSGYLALRLYLLDETRERYLARTRELLRTVWDADALAAEADQLQRLADPHLSPRERQRMARETEELLRFVCTREEAVLNELSYGPPLPPIRLDATPCTTMPRHLSPPTRKAP